MTRLELLAPARDLACGLAAVDHGADAVYIGAPRFGARAAVGNSIDDIRELCQYAHRFQVRVYVTVNTLIYDPELADTERLFHQLYEAGVDAVLVQDMGILRMDLPPIAFHASTQTDNRTADKVRWLRDLGFRRVVLARELSAQDIAKIHAEVPDVELEVFVHGALCVSYSGICYASQHSFGRSANRGTCAQFCRMKFDLVDADGREWEHQRHLLSLKDLNQHAHLEELIEAGATSFKIEGRLKDVSYVKNVVAAYSQRLDDIIRRHPDRYQRASRGRCTYAFTPSLQKTFNRGFTTYFLQGRQPDIFSPDTPKAMGEFVGTVKELRRDSFNVAGTACFANGDGLCFLNDNHELEGFRVNRAEGNRLYPHQMPRHLRPGMGLYRNNDQEFERQLSRPTAERKIPVTMHLEATPDGFRLEADGVSVSVSCEHQQAAKPQRDNIRRQLSKLGGTPYEASGVEMAADFDYFIPNSVLTTLRQQWIETAGRATSVSPAHPMASTSSASLHDPNIANRLARDFYGAQKLTAYELAPDQRPLMQCRHCLRYALGYCVKHGGHRPEWREPLSLRLADGRTFRLEFDCKNCQMNVLGIESMSSSIRQVKPWSVVYSIVRSCMFLCLVSLTAVLLSSCYNHGQQTPDAWDLTKQQIDSISFSTTHHYSQNYNFLVRARSLPLADQASDQAFDTLYVTRGERVVVAEIQTISTDTIDSVWVKVARDQVTQGWIRESELLAGVSPDDPISEFIDFFSDTHLLVFLALCVLVGSAYAVRRLLRRRAFMVHVNDIDSFYPTLLCMLVASSATLYATIQTFNAEQWRHFYYHPSLNPFTLPLVLGLFVASVWAIIIVGVAAVEDTLHRLPTVDALLYLFGLGAVCSVLYVVFSILTLYYVGYPLLVVYVAFAVWRYLRFAHCPYRCGSCGQPIRQRGRCPHCGADNA